MKEEDLQRPEFEPKRQNRFIVTFPEHFNIVPWVVKRINKPVYTNKQWENIVIELLDPIVPSTTESLFKLIKNNQVSDFFDFSIEMLDPVGVPVEKWVITCDIDQIHFGELTYGSDDLQIITISVRPTNCILQKL